MRVSGPADPAEMARERARRKVLAMLERHPHVQRAFTTRWEADVVIVTLAVRGVGTCELAIPADRLTRLEDYACLLAMLGDPA